MGVWGDLKASYARKAEVRMEKKIEKQKGKLAVYGAKVRDIEKKASPIKERQAQAIKLAQIKQEVADKKAEIAASKIETLKHQYPRTFQTGAALKRAGKEVASFTGKTMKMAGGSYGLMRTQLAEAGARGRGRAPMRARTTRGSFVPQGDETSLSAHIAANQWYGERNVMSTEFFGQKDTRDLMGDQKTRVEMDFFGRPQNQTPVQNPQPAKQIDFLGNGNGNKKKPIRYF